MTTRPRQSSTFPAVGIDMQALGARVNVFRCAAGLSQAALARRAGVTIMVVSRLEHGNKRRLSLDAGARLAQALGLTVGQLCGLEAVAEPVPVVHEPLPPLERPPGLPDGPFAHSGHWRVLAAHILAWQDAGYTRAQIADSLNAWGIERPSGSKTPLWHANNLEGAVSASVGRLRGKKDRAALLRTYGPPRPARTRGR